MDSRRRTLTIHLLLAVVVLLVPLSSCNSPTSAPQTQPPQETTAPRNPTSVPSSSTTSASETTPADDAAAEVSPVSLPDTIADTTSYVSLPECEWGKVVSARNATIVRADPGMQPGVLFSTSGSFAKKPVDEPCDPGQSLGPFDVASGGSLVARLTGNPPAPNQWSLHNYGVGLTIVYRPLLGTNDYGREQTVLSFALPAEETEAEMGGSWPGPGRLWAYIGAPWGTGPLTSSCFEQAYTAVAEIVEVYAGVPAQPGMTLRDGDTIISNGHVLISGSWIYLPTDTLIGVGQQSAGVRPPRLSPPPPAASGTVARVLAEDIETAFLDEVVRVLQELGDPAAADITKLRNQQPSKVLFGAVSGGGNAEWDRVAGTMTIRRECVAGLYGDRMLDLGTIFDTAATIVHELVHSKQYSASWGLSCNSNDAGTGHFDEQEAYYEQLDAVHEWCLAQMAKWEEGAADPCEQLNTARTIMALTGAWSLIMESIESKDITKRPAALKQYEDARAAVDRTQADLKLTEELAAAALREWYLGGPSPDRRNDLYKFYQTRKADVEQGIVRLREAKKKLAEWQQVFGSHGLPAQGVWYASDGVWFALKDRSAQSKEIAASKARVEAWIAKVEKDCPEKADPYTRTPSRRCEKAYVDLTLKKGRVNAISTPAGTASPTISVPLKGQTIKVVPNGTSYSVERSDETAIVRVYDGEVQISSDQGLMLTVAAGQQVTLPDGEIGALAPEPEMHIDGIPLAELRLDIGTPEPYGVQELRAVDGRLPADWLWQEPNKALNGPGDATIEALDSETWRITAPNENEFWASRYDAPRLLHKVTGDFDLVAEVALNCAGKDYAVSEFVLFTPDTPLGYLQGQMQPGSLGSNYCVLGGGRYNSQGKAGLRVTNRKWAECPDAPDTPVLEKLTRRGDLFRSYWSTDNGESWTLSSRNELSVSETVWIGWLFKRMAWDGLPSEPAVITLQGVQLSSAPLGSLPNDGWDLMDDGGKVLALSTTIGIAQDGTDGAYAEAYGQWGITGDLDLIVAFDGEEMLAEEGQERYISVAISSNDGSNYAYVQNALTRNAQHYDADMALNNTWYRWRTHNSTDHSGRLRLVRQDGIVSGYYWQDDDWVMLADWQEGFDDTTYVNLRLRCKSPTPMPQIAWFSIERLVTEEGVLIGGTDEVP